MPTQTHDLNGQTFGRWSAIRSAGYLSRHTNGRVVREAAWHCKCACGTEKVVRASQLRRGKSLSCGCYARECAAESARQVGLRNAKNEGHAAARAVFARYKYDAKRRGYSFDLSFEQAMALFLDRCAYCGAVPANEVTGNYNGAFVYSGIDRQNNSLGYTMENCVSCCHRCNDAKRARSVDDFKDWILRCYDTMFGERRAGV